jgi:YNFM family putative membrane transporter
VTLLCAVTSAVFMPKERRFLKSGGFMAGIGFMVAHLRNRQLLATYAVGFGVLFAFVGIFTYINFVLAAPPFLLSTQALGTIFVVYLVGILLPPFSAPLVARIGRRGLVAAASGLWIAGLCLTLIPSLTAILLGLAVCVSCGFLCQSCATSYVAITARQGRSSAVGLYVAFYYVGGGAGAVLVGYGWTLGGWPGCVALVSAVVALTAAFAWLVWRDPA